MTMIEEWLDIKQFCRLSCVQFSTDIRTRRVEPFEVILNSQFKSASSILVCLFVQGSTDGDVPD